MSRYARRAHRTIKTSRETLWAVYRTKTGGLGAHEIMLAHLIEPENLVAYVTAPSGALAIEAVRQQPTRGP